MKKELLLIVMFGFLIVSVTFAQTDSTHSIGKNKKKLINHGPSRTKQSPSQLAQYKQENKLKIEIDQIPDALRQTLEGAKEYRGWHFGTFYVDQTTKQYILQLTDAANKIKSFIFDESGKLLQARKAPNKKKVRKQPGR